MIRIVNDGALAKLLNSREAAQVLGISERKLWSMKDAGDIPHIKHGRTVRYDPDDLELWVESQKSARLDS